MSRGGTNRETVRRVIKYHNMVVYCLYNSIKDSSICHSIYTYVYLFLILYKISSFRLP